MSVPKASPPVYKGLPGFAIDPETGRYYPVPVDIKGLYGTGTYVPKPKKRKDSEASSTQPLKSWKGNNNGVSYNHPRTRGVKGPTPKATSVEKPLEKKESKGYSFKCPVNRQLKFTTGAKSNKDVTTPTNQAAIEEFVKLEQLYKTPQIAITSPESKSEVLGPMNQKELIIAEIKRISKQNEELSEDMEAISRKMKENNIAIMSLVAKLDENSDSNIRHLVPENEEKENLPIRRSLRLQHNGTKSPIDSSPRMGSATILEPGKENSRVQKAVNMYNSTRTTCSALLTPKFSRGQLRQPQAGPSLRNNLSIRVQEQCLMLQDTPGHK